MIDPENPDYSNTPASDQRPASPYAPADPLAPPFVTVVTPFYNTGEVFEETARSVFGQSFQQWEWLIINDGTEDPSALGRLDAYRRCDPRVRVIDHPTNLGLSAARNTGYREARAAYVVQLDSDDLLEPTAIEKWCWFLESHPEYAFAKGYTVGFGAQQYLWNKGFHHGREFLEANLVNPTAIVRRKVHEAVGGYDETDRGGLMDWDFWLRCASTGHWGGTVPEYLDWYRRRESHADLWPDFDEGRRQRAYRSRLRKRYAPLWKGSFPRVEPPPRHDLPEDVPCENRLKRTERRLLFLVPWMSCGGADKFNLDLLGELTRRGWEVTVATTLNGDATWAPEYACHTPDLFVLANFLRVADYPRFLRYLIRSRQVDAVLISHSELGYRLLPYLRAYAPEVAVADYCHIEEPGWKNGGYPRLSVDFGEFLDLSIVSSGHLKRWMVGQGADPERIRVCHTNVDADTWRPDRELRRSVRDGLGLADATPVILFAGRICDQKQPEVLVEALRRLRDRGSNFVGLVAGGGPDLWRLRARVREHRLEATVRLLGEVPVERVRALMAAADLFFLPSKWEGISLAIYEAMASGLPVVSADVGGQRELVVPECGILLARGDGIDEAGRYAEALAGLLAMPERRAALGRAARERVGAHFQVARMGQRMDALLEEARLNRGSNAQPTPDLEGARTLAVEALELLKIDQQTVRFQDGRPATTLGQRCYVVAQRLFDPVFQWGMRRGWTWLVPLAERIKRVLLR